jgi:hypothetical protein
MKSLLLALAVLLVAGCRTAPRRESVTLRFSADTEHGITELEIVPPK